MLSYGAYHCLGLSIQFPFVLALVKLIWIVVSETQLNKKDNVL